MPDILMLCTPEAGKAMTSQIFRVIGHMMQLAVSDAWDTSTEKVAVYKIVAEDTINANPLQILCIGSHTPEREARLLPLREAMVEGIELLRDREICNEFFDEIKMVEVWPMVPIASWRGIPVG